MKIALTGASGALGREFLAQHPDTIPVRVRLGEYEELLEVLPVIDVLIHAGALLEGPNEDLWKANILTPHQIFALSEKYPHLHTIFISSMSVLDVDGEAKALDALKSYSLTKRIAERQASPRTIVRFSTLFYRDPQRDGLSKIIHSARTTGKVSVNECKRDFLPLPIACQLLHNVCGRTEFYGQALNLGTGKTTSLVEVALHLREKYGVETEFRPGGTEVFTSFPFPEFYGLPPVKVDIYKEIDDYYKSIGES